MPNPTITIHVDVKPPFDIIAQRFRSVDIPSAAQKGIEEYAFSVERYSKLESPIDTGRLRASIATDIGNLRARIAPHVNYAIFVHEGTKFMSSRPFMSIGMEQAQAKLFGGKGPFVTALEKELDSKLK